MFDWYSVIYIYIYIYICKHFRMVDIKSKEGHMWFEVLTAVLNIQIFWDVRLWQPVRFERGAIPSKNQQIFAILDCRLPSCSRWELRSSVSLNSEQWQFLTDVLGQPIGPECHKGITTIRCVMTQRSATLKDIPINMVYCSNTHESSMILFYFCKLFAFMVRYTGGLMRGAVLPTSVFAGQSTVTISPTPLVFLIPDSKLLWPTPNPVTLLPIGSGYFQAKSFPIYIPQHSQTQSFFIPTCLRRWNRQSVPKRRHTKFRRPGITQKKAYNKDHQNHQKRAT